MEQNKFINPHASALQIGIDIGGTFTDFVVYDPKSGSLETFKRLSTSHNPAEAVLSGLAEIVLQRSGLINGWVMDIIHGSTVATNALLERKGARTAFITTSGFRDMLHIARQNRLELYDLTPQPVEPLAPAELCFEVNERVDANGKVIQALDPDEIEMLATVLTEKKVEATAICFLFSFLHPEHEREVANTLRSAGLLVSVSSEILPEFREYERASTTVVNAYVSPVLERYLTDLERAIFDQHLSANLRVMQSNGGNLSIAEARQRGVHCILSGPAGGVVGAKYMATIAQRRFVSQDREDANEPLRIITFDMGGTSTDVALIDGDPQITTEAQVGGCPIGIPLLDIHTIGAGGGSIARVDAGGALRVGPESAGADPGPACYGRGDLPTVTDANLVLGRLAAEMFLGGKMPLDAERAKTALSRLGDALGVDMERAALGVVEIANAHMERALRVISVERGHDPRDFTLFSFGGSGGLHAVDLARRLGIRRVLAPPLASTLSAFGMLSADMIKDLVLTVMLPGSTPFDALELRFLPLVEKAKSELIQSMMVSDPTVAIPLEVERSVDMRYQGQSYELRVPFTGSLLDDFRGMHIREYGYARPEAAVELVNLRVRAIRRIIPPYLAVKPIAGTQPERARLGIRQVVLGSTHSPRPVPFYQGERLEAGNQIDGPAVVIRSDTTILIGAIDHAWVDEYTNLWIDVGGN